MKMNFNKVFSKVISFVLIAAMALTFCSCGKADDVANTDSTPATVSEKATSSVKTLGEGATKFNFNVVDIEGNTTEFVINTDEKTVGAALLKVDLIKGDESQYGLYVKKVNGITADYDTDGTYWAFYINGEMAPTGVDSTDVVAGATYEFKVSK